MIRIINCSKLGPPIRPRMALAICSQLGRQWLDQRIEFINRAVEQPDLRHINQSRFLRMIHVMGGESLLAKP
jgi:hypothetical protein